jgi:4-hydroxy-tetrahydrodipicolinate synthase
MNQTNIVFSGSMTALATPFRDGVIDEPAFVRLCERQIARGTTALVVCGSTGEAASLSTDEQASLIRLAVTTASGHVPWLPGAGAHPPRPPR